jgi:hypothetical protein
MSKRLFKTMVALLAIAAAATGPARAQIYGNNIDLSYGESGTLSSDMTCTYFIVYNQGTLTVNQGVTLTLNCGDEFNLKTNSAIHLHGTMTGSVGDDADWNNNSYINVYLSDGAKYTVTGLECNDGDGYLRYYGYDAATDGHGTVSVTNGPTAVTASSIGYETTTYTFTATPASGYHFVNWTKGAGGEELGTDASIDVTCEQNGQYQVYANFEEDAPTPHTVRFAAGNDGWTVTDVDSARSATAPAVLQNVMAGDSLVVTAPATLPGKVKSVKAVKYVAPAATVTTAPTATEAYIEAGSTTELVNAGVANGGTMMYAVTTTNAQPASTANFSTTIPTAEGRAAGTYYVWYYAKADADHSDSEIAGPVSDTLVVMSTVTWNSTNVFNSAHQNDQLDKWHTNPLTYESITISFNGSGASSSFSPYNPSQDGKAVLECFGAQSAVYTFTAPSGKKFCKIEIINNGGVAFTNYGDWTRDVIHKKIVWSGTAANAVTLGTVFTDASNLNSIVFTLIDD